MLLDPAKDVYILFGWWGLRLRNANLKKLKMRSLIQTQLIFTRKKEKAQLISSSKDLDQNLCDLNKKHLLDMDKPDHVELK